MSSKDKGRFKTREWWMLIALIISIQWIIHFCSTKAMASVEMVGYVSFAGTLVSTILAVLAIIYSFVQSTSQQTSSEIISREVHRLQNIVGDVNESTEKINSSLIRLPEIMKQLEDLHASLDASVQRGIAPIKEQHERIFTMLSSFDQLREHDGTDNANIRRYLYMYYTSIAGMALSSYAIINSWKMEEYYIELKGTWPDKPTNLIDSIFIAAISSLSGYYMEDILEAGFENEIRRNSKCNDEKWNDFIKHQQLVQDDIKGTMETDGFAKNMPNEIQEFIKHMLSLK